MKRFLGFLFGVFLLLPTQVFAGISLISGGQCTNSNCIAQGSNNSTITTVTSSASTVDVPVGSLVYISTTVRANSNASSCTDTAGNTYSAPVQKLAGTNNQSVIFSWAITTIDAPIGTTWTCNNASTTAKGIQVAAFSGAASSPLDAASATPASGTGTVQSVGPTGILACPGGGSNCEVLIANWTNRSTGAQSSQTAGFTNFGCNTSNFANMCMAYEIVSATTAQSYSSTNASSDGWAIFLEAFKTATASITNCSLLTLGVGSC